MPVFEPRYAAGQRKKGCALQSHDGGLGSGNIERPGQPVDG
jgi:hypothetical protein